MNAKDAVRHKRLQGNRQRRSGQNAAAANLKRAERIAAVHQRVRQRLPSGHETIVVPSRLNPNAVRDQLQGRNEPRVRSSRKANASVVPPNGHGHSHSRSRSRSNEARGKLKSRK